MLLYENHGVWQICPPLPELHDFDSKNEFVYTFNLETSVISRAVGLFIMFFVRTLEPTLPRRNSRETLYISESGGSEFAERSSSSLALLC